MGERRALAAASLALGILYTVAQGQALGARVGLGDEVKQWWVRHVSPLPKRIEVTGAADVPVGYVRVHLGESPTQTDLCALQELAATIAEAGGMTAELEGEGVPGKSFDIYLSRHEKDRELLGRHPNCEQAYSIRPLWENGRLRGLVCRALTDSGTYYAVQTLRQLLSADWAAERQPGLVRFPAVWVEDWPDLEERGQWGGSSEQDLEWLASHKMNLIERHAVLTVDESGVAHATMPQELMERGRRHAVRIVPIIHHLEQLQDTGLFEAYPQTRAVGADAICFAQPVVTQVLAQWLTDLGKTSGVSDVMIWLSEEGKGCQCEECRKEDRFVKEVQVCLQAWERAKQECPHLGLRLLLTQASYPSNDKVLAAVPEGVKVSYYHGGLTYDTSRRPMIYPLLEQYAQKGRWLGVYPTLGANWLIVAPFSNPGFIHYRMTEFVDKGLRCLVGYAVPTNTFYPVNVEAAAEWAWNAHGRSVKEFSLAYAVRHGIRPPERYAAWLETIGPVSWDLYGSRFPYLEYFWRNLQQMARGRVKVALGEGFFEEFQREEQLAENISRCDAALIIAEELGHEPSILETRIVRGYSRILQAVWELHKLLEGGKKPEDADLAATQGWLAQMRDACSEVIELYPRWGAALSGLVAGHEPQRFWGTVHLMEDVVNRLAPLLDEFGVSDPDRAYRARQVGEWRTEDFAEAREQVRRIDVSGFVDGPGVYEMQPRWRDGTLGLGVSRMALVSYLKDRPEELREESVDVHDGHAGAWVRGDRYVMELKDYDARRGYAVLAYIRGGETTNGAFFFRKLRTPAP